MEPKSKPKKKPARKTTPYETPLSQRMGRWPLKYRNIPTEYNGRMFDSKHEAEVAQQLDLRRFATNPSEKVVDIEYQHFFKLVVKGKKIANYIADFIVTYEDGHKEVVEAKGYRTRDYKIKKRLFEAINNTKIIEV